MALDATITGLSLIFSQCKMQTGDCRLWTRGKIQTESKMQAGCKMQNEDCRLGVKCGPNINCRRATVEVFEGKKSHKYM